MDLSRAAAAADAPAAGGRYLGILHRIKALDTRKKIVEQTALPRNGACISIAKGWFDVLTAEHCDLLARARPADGSLLVLVHRETPERPAPLVAYDRAQMLAALGCVDLVCICDASNADSIAADLGTDSALDVDAIQASDVVRHVIERQGS